MSEIPEVSMTQREIIAAALLNVEYDDRDDADAILAALAEAGFVLCRDRVAEVDVTKKRDGWYARRVLHGEWCPLYFAADSTTE